MNLTAAQAKAALQAKLDAEFGENKYTVGDGVETICPLSDLQETSDTGDEQNLYYGSLSIRTTKEAAPAQVSVIGNTKHAQCANSFPKQTCAQVQVPVGGTAQLNEQVFAYLEGSNIKGIFTGFAFPVTTTYYALQENGFLEVGEDGNPVVRP